MAYTSKEHEEIEGVLTITVDEAGNQVGETRGFKTITRTTEYAKTTYNHYRFLTLPIGVGYRSAGRKNYWELSGGLDINLLFRADGTIYNPDNALAPFKPGNSCYRRIFRRNTGTGVWASYAYNWRMTDQLCWQLAVDTQLPLHAVSAPDYPLVQRYFNFGAQVGVAYRMKGGK